MLNLWIKTIIFKVYINLGDNTFIISNMLASLIIKTLMNQNYYSCLIKCLLELNKYIEEKYYIDLYYNKASNF
jgi:hypothetical protein